MKNYTEITKIKLNGKKADLYYEEHVFDSEDREHVNKHTFTGGGLVHEDFTTALAALRKHVIEICELGPSTKPKAIEVVGITLMGLDSDDGSKVCIIAQKVLKNGKRFPINPPATTLFDEEKYPLAEDLDKKCAKIRAEATAYQEGTKFAPPSQLDMFEKAPEEVGSTLALGPDGILEVEEKQA